MLKSCIPDVNHWRAPGDVKAASQDGTLALIAKATQGLSFKDSSFNDWRGQSARLLPTPMPFGSYAYGTVDLDDPIKQADFYLATIGVNVCPTKGFRMLDIEHNDKDPRGSMSGHGARLFAERVGLATGDLPVIYGGAYLASLLEKMSPDDLAVLAKCPLMWAEYGPTPHWPAKVWPEWKIWQYTGDNEGIAGRHKVNGLGVCDISDFNGTLEELLALFATA